MTTFSPSEGVTLTLYGAQAQAHFEDSTMAGLDAAGEFLAEKMREKVRTPYPPASTPGNPPHARTYELHDSIRVLGKGKDWIAVGSDSPHAEPLELGTANMEARPFVKPTMNENQFAVMQIVQATATRQGQQTTPTRSMGSFAAHKGSKMRQAVSEGLASLRWFAQTMTGGTTR